MGTTFNRPGQTCYRRLLRRTSTLAERILWRRIRDLLLRGCKFGRQHGIGQYIVDFFCPELMLAIELDGPEHALRQGRIKSDKGGLNRMQFTSCASRTKRSFTSTTGSLR